jgi:hypothetical protein
MKFRAILLSLACSLGAGDGAAGLLNDVGVELSHDDNVTRAELERDIKSETSLTVSAAAGPRFQLTDYDSLALTASVALDAHRHYDGLDNVSAGLALTWRRKIGLGPYVPQLGLSVSATRLDYRDALRDGWLYAAEAEASKRLSERLTVRAIYRNERRRADDTPDRVVSFVPADVFDLRSHSLGISGEFAWDPRYVVSAGYTVHRGDIVSTTQRNLPVFLASRAIARDPVFGDDTFAYTLRAVTHALNLGVSRVIGRQASLSLGYEYRDSRADGGIDYRSNVVRAIYLYGF